MAGADSLQVARGLSLLLLHVLTSSPGCTCGSREQERPQVDAGSSATIVEARRRLMGTEFHVSVSTEDPVAARVAITAALDEVARVERVLSPVNAESEVSRLNASAGDEPVPLSAATIALLGRALELSELTGGAFDVTYAALSPIWRSVREDPPQLPTDESIDAARALVGWRDLVLDREGSTAFLRRVGMAINLGGIGKGHGVDRAGEVLVEHGLDDFIVGGGGDLLVRGSKRGTPWRLGIQHPRRHGELLGEVILPRDMSLVTSGDYERFVEIEGVRYHHILDPRTGRPARGCAGVTLAAPNATTADAMATAVFVLGPADGMRLVEATEGVEVLIVDAEMQLTMSAGMRPLVRLRD